MKIPPTLISLVALAFWFELKGFNKRLLAIDSLSDRISMRFGEGLV
jgi:hypothetical protein